MDETTFWMRQPNPRIQRLRLPITKILWMRLPKTRIPNTILLKELIIEGKHCYFVTLHVFWDCVEQGQGITRIKESVLLLNRHNLTCSCETGYRILPKKQETFPNHSFRIKGACHRKRCVFTLGQSIFCIPVLSMTKTWLLMFSEWFNCSNWIS